MVLDMGFSSLPHSPHRRWLILSHSYLRALKLSALSIKVTFNMWIFGLSHKLLELSFQRYKKTLRRYSRTLFFRRFCGKLIFCVYFKILLEGLKYSFYRRKEGCVLCCCCLQARIRKLRGFCVVPCLWL